MGKKADKGADAATTVEPQVDVETELKFEVPRRWAMPRLEKLPQVASVDGPRRFTQTATYLDTSSLALLRGKHTLRRRTGGTDAGWHLKTPSTADDGARVEHRLPLGRSAAIVPPVLHDLVADLAGGDALVPVARLRTRRTRRTLRDSAGAALVLVEDDVVEATTFVDGERVLRWREIEVELADGGTAADLQAVSEALIEAGLTPSDSPSKLSRALAQPLEGITSTKKKNLTAGDVVLSYLSQQIGVLQASEQRLRDDEPDAVHKARVATRRLRSTLRSYRALLHRGETDDLRAEVKWLTGVLGGPRDGEVMLERLDGLLNGLDPDLVVDRADVHIREALQAEHASAHAALVKALDSTRYERLMGDLTDLLLEPPTTKAAQEKAKGALPALVGKASTKVTKQADRAQAMKEGPERDEAIHDIRKLAKAARYAGEAAGKASGVKAKDLVGAWTDLQEALGDHQDSIVSRGVVLRLAADARKKGQDTFTYGVLAERESALARSVEENYGPLLEAARSAAASMD